MFIFPGTREKAGKARGGTKENGRSSQITEIQTGSQIPRRAGRPSYARPSYIRVQLTP